LKLQPEDGFIKGRNMSLLQSFTCLLITFCIIKFVLDCNIINILLIPLFSLYLHLLRHNIVFRINQREDQFWGLRTPICSASTAFRAAIRKHYILAYIFTYLLSYLLHGTESILRS